MALGALAAPACKKPTVVTQPVTVAAAADLAFAFRDLAPLYEKATGQPVVFSFGSTGVLAKQIAEGAPFDAFAAANASFADDAVSSGACLADSRRQYATGRIVVYVAHGAPLAPKTLVELTDARIAKIAIANPEHAPYGRAAREAMQRAGVWDSVSTKVVYGENVQQALQFAQSGNADVAIVALSLAIVSPGEWTIVPGELHAPIDQVIVACSHGRGGAASGRRFVDFVRSDAARTVMRKYGFLLPGELSTF
jgi:molybdate transport system substrate-binding protein